MIAKHFDAELHDWIVITHPPSPLGWVTNVDVIRNDRKGRLIDGRTIRTSALLTPAEQIRQAPPACTSSSPHLLGQPARRN